MFDGNVATVLHGLLSAVTSGPSITVAERLEEAIDWGLEDRIIVCDLCVLESDCQHPPLTSAGSLYFLKIHEFTAL